MIGALCPKVLPAHVNPAKKATLDGDPRNAFLTAKSVWGPEKDATQI